MSAPLDLANLFSTKGMVALVTGGGTGRFTPLSFKPAHQTMTAW